MQPTDEEMQQMYAERVARDVRIALTMKRSEMVIVYPDYERVIVGNNHVRMLTTNCNWCNITINRAEVTNAGVMLFDDDRKNIFHLIIDNIKDIYWDAL